MEGKKNIEDKQITNKIVMAYDIRKWVNKENLILLFIIALGAILIYVGLFLINFTRDKITSMTYNNTWKVDWVGERPFVREGWCFLITGLILLIIGMVLLWRKIRK